MLRSLLGRPVAYIAAKYRSRRTAPRKVLWVVLHSMELPENRSTAERLGRFWATITKRQTSSHYGVDVDSTCQYVSEQDVAYHCAGLNENSVGVEQAGYARQTAAEWDDANSRAMIDTQTIPLVADLCRRHGIPARFATAADILAGRPGITTHLEANKAKGKSTHTDPGLAYPIARVIQGVASILSPAPAAAVSRPKPKVVPVATAVDGVARMVAGIARKPVKYHESGERVRLVQKLLNAKGFTCVVDGEFGLQTRSAVIRFQTVKRLKPVDGIVGRDTINALL